VCDVTKSERSYMAQVTRNPEGKKNLKTEIMGQLINLH
jgi:hypothetical protein